MSETETHTPENDADDRARRSVNGHTLELRSTYWRCLQCGHRFENAADAEGFWCGDDCAGRHRGETGQPAGENEGHAATPVWAACDQGAPRHQTRAIPPAKTDDPSEA